MIEYNEMVSYSDTRIDLEVSVSGMKIVVGAGAFKVGDIDYELPEDIELDLEQAESQRRVMGYLVKTGDEVTVLYDIQELGEPAYLFSPDGPYQLLSALLVADVPSGAQDLEEAKVELYRILPRKERTNGPQSRRGS